MHILKLPTKEHFPMKVLERWSVILQAERIIGFIIDIIRFIRLFDDVSFVDGHTCHIIAESVTAISVQPCQSANISLNLFFECKVHILGNNEPMMMTDDLFSFPFINIFIMLVEIVLGKDGE